MTLTCTRKGEIYRREERGERREERGERKEERGERKGIKWALAQWRDFNTKSKRIFGKDDRSHKMRGMRVSRWRFLTDLTLLGQNLKSPS